MKTNIEDSLENKKARKKEVKMTRNIMKKAIAAIALVLMGGAVLFLGALATFGVIAALGL